MPIGAENRTDAQASDSRISWSRLVSVMRNDLILNEVLSEPEPMLTRTPRIPGTDGRKMSKSYGNFISLSESDDSIRTKARAMMTDPARKRRSDPGNPDVCPVFDWHKLFPEEQTPEKRARINRISLECRTARSAASSARP